MIKSIIFDFYGTLTDIHTDEDKDQVWDKFALFFSYFVGNVEAKMLKNTYKILVKKYLPSSQNTSYPEIDLIHVFKGLFLAHGYSPTTEEVLELAKVFRMLSTDHIKLYPHTLELLEWLQEKEIDLYILSNAQRCFIIPELKKLKIADYFKKIYISSDYEIAKPDIRFINKLMDQENMPINSCVFIGNDPSTDIALANKINMTSVYLHSNCSPPLKAPIRAEHVINPNCLLSVKDILSDLI